MKRIAILAALVVSVLVLPGGCAVSLALAGGVITAAAPVSGCPTASGTDAAPCPQTASVAGVVVDPASVPAPDAQAAVAVAAALTAVSRGGRYVAEGNGPVDFDCSGLTSWAWRQAGISLVDYSYTQRSQTRDIPRALAQPGDLVFWFGGAEHHVAIITAVDGAAITIAEAANPQAGIRTRLLGDGWDTAYLTGFGRVIRT
jgi:hypothetical protein